MRESTIVMAAAAALAGLHAAGAAHAQMPAEAPGEERFYWENDEFYWIGERTDRYYTNGLRLESLAPSARSDGNFLPGISHTEWCSLLCGKGSRSGAVNTGYAVGQNMYTPENIRTAAPQPYDRPWGGLLYGSRIARITYEDDRLNAQRQDRIELSVGMVGPAALAGEAQIAWHDLIQGPDPKGWRNQLRNEPVLQLRYDTALRWPKKEGGHADIIPRLRGNVGNALTSLDAEVTARIGWNLSGFGAQAIPFPAPSALHSADKQAKARTSLRVLASGNLFARAGVRAVARNIFLDGNSFADNDIRLDRKPLVTEYAAGAEFNLVGPLWITFQFVRRSSEFETWRGRDAPAQKFGAATLVWTIAR